MSSKFNSLNLTLKTLHPVKNYPAAFALRGLLDYLLNKFSYPYWFYTPASQLLQFSHSRQFPSALVPGIKNDRSINNFESKNQY